MQNRVKLVETIKTLFAPDEWHRFLRTEYPDVAEHVSAHSSASELFIDSVDLLDRRGELDDAFFNRLQALRPKRIAEIRQIQRSSISSEVVYPFVMTPKETSDRSRLIVMILAGLSVAASSFLAGHYYSSERAQSVGDLSLVDACRQSFLNLEDDVQRVGPDQDLRVILKEHVAECRPLMRHLWTLEVHQRDD